MAEWSKAHAWKACILEIVSRVRIPVFPINKVIMNKKFLFIIFTFIIGLFVYKNYYDLFFFEKYNCSIYTSNSFQTYISKRLTNGIKSNIKQVSTSSCCFSDADNIIYDLDKSIPNAWLLSSTQERNNRIIEKLSAYDISFYPDNTKCLINHTTLESFKKSIFEIKSNLIDRYPIYSDIIENNYNHLISKVNKLYKINTQSSSSIYVIGNSLNDLFNELGIKYTVICDDHDTVDVNQMQRILTNIDEKSIIFYPKQHQKKLVSYIKSNKKVDTDSFNLYSDNPVKELYSILTSIH